MDIRAKTSGVFVEGLAEAQSEVIALFFVCFFVTPFESFSILYSITHFLFFSMAIISMPLSNVGAFLLLLQFF